MLLIDLLRALRHDARLARFGYINGILRNIPGEVGFVLRSWIVARYFKRAGAGVMIYPGARFDGVGMVSVGDRVRIGVDNYFQASAGLTIGNDTIFGPGVRIWTINHRFDSVEKPIVEQGWNERAVSIGANVWIGAGVFIMPGVEIPDGCIVSAASVVGVRQYPEYSVIAGHPARVIGRRGAQAPARDDSSAAAAGVDAGQVPGVGSTN